MSKRSLEGKVGLIFGVANKNSIAWGIAKAWHQAGAKLIFSYQNERLKGNVQDLANELDSQSHLFPCDVSSDGQIKDFFIQVQKNADQVDLLLHSLAYAPRESLANRFVETSREAFNVAHEISTYSLIALTREALPLMKKGGSVVTLSFYGSQKVIPHYNVMGVSKAALEASVRYLASDLGSQGIRVNAISAGAMNTLAARGISDFTEMLKYAAKHSPLKRNVEMQEIGETGLFLAMDGASGITGQVLYVDCGQSVIGMRSYDDELV
jgi:enoyl-[acyl-carrier protein] reductase I